MSPVLSMLPGNAHVCGPYACIRKCRDQDVGKIEGRMRGMNRRYGQERRAGQPAKAGGRACREGEEAYPVRAQCSTKASQRWSCRRASAWPTTRREDRARVRPTFIRRSSATKPMPPPCCVRTGEKIIMSFSLPCWHPPPPFSVNVTASEGLPLRQQELDA